MLWAWDGLLMEDAEAKNGILWNPGCGRGQRRRFQGCWGGRWGQGGVLGPRREPDGEADFVDLLTPQEDRWEKEAV